MEDDVKKARRETTAVFRIVSAALAATMLSGCTALNGQGALSSVGLTKFGYVPASLSRGWGELEGDEGALRYQDVRQWAESVADGYDSRSTFNRHSVYIGAFVAAAAAGALAGLGAFDPSNSAITGIPIGTAFLGSVASYYQNEDKAKLYERANSAIVALVGLADFRRHLEECSSAADGHTRPADCPAASKPRRPVRHARQKHEPLTQEEKVLEEQETRDVDRGVCIDDDPRQSDALSCLRWDVENVVRSVNAQRIALDPQDVGKDLKDSALKVKEALEAGGMLDAANRKKVTKAAVDKMLADVTHLLGDDFLKAPQTVCCLPSGYLGDVVIRKPDPDTSTDESPANKNKNDSTTKPQSGADEEDADQ